MTECFTTIRRGLYGDGISILNQNLRKYLNWIRVFRAKIWDAEAANGKIYYETGVYEKGERQKGQYVFDEDYRKAKHPIAVTKPVMTVVMGGENVFLQSAAPGERNIYVEES